MTLLGLQLKTFFVVIKAIQIAIKSQQSHYVVKSKDDITMNFPIMSITASV